jgi:hypothetical protein
VVVATAATAAATDLRLTPQAGPAVQGLFL